MEIKSVYIQGHDSSYGGYKVKYVASIQVDAVEFKKLKGNLGSLVLEVNNALYSLYGVPAYSPSIDSSGSKRSKNGVKTLVFEYFSNDMDRAEQLGLDILRLRNGEALVKHGSHVKLSRAAECSVAMAG